MVTGIIITGLMMWTNMTALDFLNDETSSPVYISMSSTMTVQGGSVGESIKKTHQTFATFCNSFRML
jgi:hypothetical protein